MYVVALRQNIKDLLAHFNLCLFQSGNGIKSVWTSSPAFQKPRKEMMPYRDLRQRFWWTRMKREIAQFIAECDVCRRVKAEHQRPAGTLQPLPIPEWKWDKVGMDKG